LWVQRIKEKNELKPFLGFYGGRVVPLVNAAINTTFQASIPSRNS